MIGDIICDFLSFYRCNYQSIIWEIINQQWKSSLESLDWTAVCWIKCQGAFLYPGKKAFVRLQPKQQAALTSESREGGRERGRGEGTVGPGQTGLALAAGQTSRQTEEEHKRRVRVQRRSVSSWRGSEN